ncbi:MAG TPA: ABC transporter permease [Planctomycetota bacterium]|nr:ABC transporter permease [Planctomycetota bacterium]
MYRLFLAARYVLSRRVSYLGMVAIALAVGALIVVVSVMNGFLSETRTLVRGTTADVIVTPMQDTSLGQPMPRQALEELVRRQPGVAGAVARLVRPAIVKVYGASTLLLNLAQFSDLNFVTALGIDTAAEKPVSGLDLYLGQVEDASLRVADAARPFSIERARIRDPKLRNAGLPTCLVGEDRMETLGLRPGDALVLVTTPDSQDLSGDTLKSTTQTFVIAGAFRTNHHPFDMASVFVDREAFLDWTGTRTEVSELYVRVEDGRPLDGVRDGLQSALRRAGLDVQVETWMDRHRVYLGAVENERTILGVVLSLFVLLTCTITFSMLTMMVQEKIRDIGILSAMGASAGGIGAIFATAGTAIAAGGALLGLLAGDAVATNVDAVKDWIESTFDIQIFRRDVYAFTTIPSVVDDRLNLAIAGVTVAFALVICLVPAIRAARLDPVEALRHD